MKKYCLFPDIRFIEGLTYQQAKEGFINSLETQLVTSQFLEMTKRDGQ